MKKDKEESLRIGGRDLSIWYDKEETLWKAVVLELLDGKWVEIFAVMSPKEKRVRPLFDEAIRTAKALVAKEGNLEREVVEHSSR